MPRVARIVIENVPHHVTQRGNNRQDIFFADDDRRVYLDLLKERSAACGLRILGYCLMTNHVHVVAVPRSADALARAIGRTNFLYTQHINRRYGRSGHLWQNRFFSCALDEVHLWRTLSYVERNPVRAKMVRVPWRFRWSSAGAHVGADDSDELLNMKAWRAEWTPAKWRHELGRATDEDELASIRRSLHTGRPLGTDKWLSRLEARLNRRLRPLPVGRPRKTGVDVAKKRVGKTKPPPGPERK
ncbi:MAG: transposase [Planctomycetota bacterium]